MIRNYPPEARVGRLKAHFGHYIKLQAEQVTSATKLNTVFDEIQSTPNIRGIKIARDWGDCEAAQGDYSPLDDLDTIVERLRAGGKYLQLSIPWRNFSPTMGSLLPAYMQGSDGNWIDSNDPDLDHVTRTYGWAFKTGTAPNAELKGWAIKLWDSFVMDRIDALFAEIARRYDNDPVFVRFSCNETAVATPVATFGGGTTANGTGRNTNVNGSNTAYESGMTQWMNLMKPHFVQTPVVFAMNFTQAYVKARHATLATKKMGINTPNCNWKDGLNRTGTNPGVLDYFKNNNNSIYQCSEIQGDDLAATLGNDVTIAQYDFPRLQALLMRCTIELKNHDIIWQRKDAGSEPYWQGGAATSGTWQGRQFESILTFLRNLPKKSPYGGGNPQIPTNFL